MSEKLPMPKNVQAFVDKYGGIGSKEQDAAFWKEFRKAANAYANVQAKRICDLEHALAEARGQANDMREKWLANGLCCEHLGAELHEAINQRDEAREALKTGGMLNIIDRTAHGRAAAIRERDEARAEMIRYREKNDLLPISWDV